MTGTEFRESKLIISPKCEERVRAGMVVVVYIGVENLQNTEAKDAAGRQSAILLADTVLVAEPGKPNEVLPIST